MISAGKPYWNPYLGGVALGLVLLSAFVIMGRGLGASGALTSVVAAGAQAVSPAHAAANGLYAEYLGNGNPFRDWLVFELSGVFIGGLISGLTAGRTRFMTEHGPSISDGRRLVLAFAGGAIMGIGAKFARGCTSGQALTGGALLSVGSWAFMLCLFAGAYATAYFVRRQWL